MVAQFTNGLFSCPSARILKKDIMWGGKGGCKYRGVNGGAPQSEK